MTRPVWLGLLAGALLAGCATDPQELARLADRLELGPVLTAALTPGPTSTEAGNITNPPSASRPVTVTPPGAATLERTAPERGPRDRMAPRSPYENAVCTEAVRVFAEAGYQLLAKVVRADVLLDATSCRLADLSGLTVLVDGELPETLRLGAPAAVETGRLAGVTVSLTLDGTGQLRTDDYVTERTPVRLDTGQVEQLLYYPVLDRPVALDRSVGADLVVALPDPAPTAYSLVLSCSADSPGADEAVDVAVGEQVPPHPRRPFPATAPSGYERVPCDGRPRTLTAPVPAGSRQLSVEAVLSNFGRHLDYTLSGS